MRLGKEKETEKQRQIDSGFLTCKCCNKTHPLYYFNRQKKDEKVYYKDNKCKVCLTGKEPRTTKIKTYKTRKVKSNNPLSKDCKVFLERVKRLRGYIDLVDVYKLAHYHIETFGYIERLIVDMDVELVTMFNELLRIYKKDCQS